MPKLPQVKTVFFSILFLNSLAIAIAIAQSIIFDKTPGYYFRERAFVTYVSGLQLLAITYITYRIRQITIKNHHFLQQNSQFWTMVTVGFLFLALDEMLEIHERIDLLIHDLLAMEPTSVTDMIDDLIVGMYLLFALIILVKNYQQIKVFKQSFSWFKVGLGLSLLMIILDLTTNNTLIIEKFISDPQKSRLIGSWISVGEETCKLLAGGMFAVGFCHCWHIAHNRLSKIEY